MLDTGCAATSVTWQIVNDSPSQDEFPQAAEEACSLCYAMW